MADFDTDIPSARSGRPPLSGAGSRLVFLPDPRVAAAAPVLEERLEMAGRQVTGGNFASLLDSLTERMIADAYFDVKADVGLVLLRDGNGSELTVAHQVGGGGCGPDTDRNVRGLKIPAGSGRRGLVLASQQAFCGNDQGEDPLTPGSLAALLGCRIQAEIIVPFYLARQFKGLIVALQVRPLRLPDQADLPDLTDPNRQPAAGFCPKCLEEMELLSTSLGRLLDYQLICSTLGMSV